MIDTATNTKLESDIAVGTFPYGIAITPGNLDLSVSAKKKQKAKKLKLRVSCGDEIPCSVKITGKAKIPKKGQGKKTKSFKLKPKTYELQVGQTKKVTLKLKKQKKALKKIAKMQKGYKKARKRSKVVASVSATGVGIGSPAHTHKKIKLKG